MERRTHKKIKGVLKWKSRLTKEIFMTRFSLIDENRRVENPQVGYVVSAAYPAIGVSFAGDIREFILPIGR